MRVSNVTVRRRILIVLVAGLMLYLTLGTRLGYIQIVQGQWLMDKAEELWSRDVRFEPKRGKILDRNGEVLAYNISAPTVMVVPAQVKDPQQTAQALANVLDMSEEKVFRLITQREMIVRINPEGRKISNEKAREIQQLGLEGVFIAEDSKRYYPYGDFLSHVLGFAGIDNQGLTGSELIYDEILKGKPGRVSFYSDAKGQLMPNQPEVYQPPKDGHNLVLTIDANIQKIMEREVDHAVARYNPDHVIGIAMDPNTGEILAMTSRPDFDPGRYQEYPPEVYNRNLPVFSMYEPGSTFKIITLAAALEEGKVDLHNEHFHDPGFIKVANARLHCWKRGGHGHQSFLEVVENSCNPGFVELGQRLGTEVLFDYIERFGFGEKTGIDMQGEQKGLIFSPEQRGPVETATTAFGQGVAVTPIQQVAAVAAVINGGYLYTPYIAKEWHDAETDMVLGRRTPQLKRQVISNETSQKVREALESVVARGTGRNAYVEGYRVGGKTGTAQKVAPGGGYLENNHIVSFIGFAPADDPQIIVYIGVDNPKNTVQFGGVVAAPIVGRIIEDALRYMGVERRESPLQKEYVWGDEITYEVPNLIGMTDKDLQRTYFQLPIEAAGDGSVVIKQLPEPGEKVKEGSVIRVLLGEKISQPKETGDKKGRKD
ncbi:stage V sporulation protein D [Caldalkalibacillus thermarum TA2.A1]|uniref:serine-type D-Ala-D-Ala carboxypeptidase n=1 Tax=Caldalkalibacillus thermarum (strain TA2.A1) TaxID=986075 RepID=F5L8Z5_CALTT|nr:stage V sporulation protein D [Caldalkalibacillus thermarum]EGL82169.1 stage V sporulation protein D [Caldalkalibacillus thermarum TA2.A1]QZT33117.1 stage V sporulation protein D [Caldalkalibacillus thermarum TA2.A1]